MPATVTLATTTFTSPVAAGDTQILLTSTSGIVPGVFLVANREVFKVIALTGIGTAVTVLRGQAGTATQPHGTSETIYVARGDQFYATDPVGLPPTAIPVSPYLNVLTGAIWVVQGDEIGAGTGARSWQPVTSAQTIGDLGLRQTTTTTPS